MSGVGGATRVGNLLTPKQPVHSDCAFDAEQGKARSRHHCTAATHTHTNDKVMSSLVSPSSSRRQQHQHHHSYNKDNKGSEALSLSRKKRSSRREARRSSEREDADAKLWRRRGLPRRLVRDVRCASEATPKQTSSYKYYKHSRAATQVPVARVSQVLVDCKWGLERAVSNDL